MAAETNIGLGEFSQIVETESAIFDEEDVQENDLLVSPPRKKTNICLQPQIDVKVKSVTRNLAELEWMFLPECEKSFRVDYLPKGEDGVNRSRKFHVKSPCLLENLEVGTTYLATYLATFIPAMDRIEVNPATKSCLRQLKNIVLPNR